MSLKFLAATCVFMAFAVAAEATEQTRQSTIVQDTADAASQRGTYAGSHALYQDVAIPSGAAAAHHGGVNVLMGDGSVRSVNGPVGGNESISIGGNSTENAHVRHRSFAIVDRTPSTPKGSLGSLNGLGSIGDLAKPADTETAAARMKTQNNLKQIGLAAQDDTGDGGTAELPAVQSPRGAADRLSTKPGGDAAAVARMQSQNNLKQLGLGVQGNGSTAGGPKVQVFNGADGAAASRASSITMKGQAIKQN